MKDLPAVIHFIRDNTEQHEPIFVMSELQIIYFLADRESIVQKENYFTFLAAVNLIDVNDDIRLTDEQLLERMVRLQPRYIIQVTTGDATENMRAVWPKASAFVKLNYRVARIFGSYVLLEPRATFTISGA
jgi:hypothetical protein